MSTRCSIRLKGYDYANAGLYYITICIQDRQCLLGRIENQQMILNDAGTMVKQWYYEIENKYPDKKCHEMVIMPNHIHFIIENVPVGADLCVCPNNNKCVRPNNKCVRPNQTTNTCGRTYAGECDRVNKSGESGLDKPGRHVGLPLRNAPIPTVVQWFKTLTTNAYIRGVKNHQWEPFNGKL